MKWKLLVFLLATPLIAADSGAPARRDVAGMNRPQASPGGPAVGMGALGQVLTEEQRRMLREYAQAGSEKARTLQVEAFRLRRELQESVLAGEADEAAIRQKSEAIARLETEALAARMSALARVAATLTPEQKRKIKELSAQARPGGRRLRAGQRQAPPAIREPAAPPPPEK